MKFRSKQKVEQAARALAEHGTMKEAASAVGVTDRTLRAWRDTPEFRQALADAKAEAMAEAGRKLAASAGQAVDVLTEIMRSPTPPHGAGLRIRAACAILGNLALVSQGDMEERLRALEGLSDEK